MKNKKGVEMSMNVIIIAVIVLIVLAILAYLLVYQFGIFKKGTSCTNEGGICVTTGCSNPITPCPNCCKTGECCPITSTS